MATQTSQNPTRLEPPLESLLARLRRRIRSYVWADGLAMVLIVACGAFWISLAIDWVFEPPRPLKIVELAIISGALVYVLSRYLLERLFVRLSNRNMALLVERRFGMFRDSLLTAVELSQHPDHAAEFNSAMVASTRRAALTHASDVDLGQIFNVAPLARHVSLAVTLLATLLFFAVGASSAFGTWARRSLLLSDEAWPRSTRLLVEGFNDQGHAKIARGSDFNLVVKADAAVGRDIPEIVQVRYTTTDGARGRENMSREGLVSPGEAPFQNYAHSFKGVLAPLDFYVQGGDDRAGPFHLDVVDSPTITLTLHCEYPAYMHRAPRDLPGAGLTQLPRGTEITILAEANKPLLAVQIDDMADENAPLTHQLDFTQETSPKRSFTFNVPRLAGDKTLLFTLRDADGIRSREPIRLALAAVPDEPPQVNVQLKGIGTAITSQARLPAAGEVSDDYGVARIWFEYRVDETPARQQPFAATVDGQEKLAVADALEVRDLKLEPKQKLHWAVQAADTFALEGGPNVGTSQRYALDVVTPEQLRSMLEARELMLRRRFETIVEELTETRGLLASVVTGPKKPAGDAKDEKKDAAAQPVGEPGDAAEGKAGGVAPTVQVERVRQNAERSAHETLQVAVAFDEIREEMINNRVDTEELKTRLKDGVSEPLKRIVATSFPQWEERLKQLSDQLSDPQAAPATQAAALAQADAILIEMKQVLDKMLELETFNEVLDMLRQVISAQEKINAETKQKQKQKLRDLVE